MADPASSGGPSPVKPPTVYITVDFGPTPDAKGGGAPSKGAPAGPRPPMLWEPPDAADLGRVLPGYEVLSLIGSGGMGAVYRARQKSLERLVAVKVLSPELAQRAPEFTERFNSEASALAKLSHPSIVHLFDCGRTKDGQLYIAMELVDGKDVAERLGGKQPLPAAEALSIAVTVCEALAHAHQRGVIHRDIKPANVMLDAAGRVKITDFGLARIIQTSGPKEQKTTSLLGTPRFTAPEAMVPGAEVDARVDIFSVGVMLYQMLTGEVPRGAAPPPSEAVPGLDKRLDAIVAKAMAESPDERYPDANRLREALEALQKVPDLVDLPAATMANLKKAPAQKPRSEAGPAARSPRQAPGREHEEDDHEDDDHHGYGPPPQPRSQTSLMPWIFTAAVIAVGGYWGWQQYKNPDEGLLVGATATNRITTVESKDKPSAVSPPTTPFAPTAPSPPPGIPEPTLQASPQPPPQPTPAAVMTSAPPQNSISMPVPVPIPDKAPSGEDLTEAQRRIAQIQGDFTASVKEWQAGQNTKFDQLDVQYLRAVKGAIVSVRNARQLEDLAGLEEEEKQISTRTPLAPVSGNQPERRRLRAIYDGQVKQIAHAGAEVKVEIYNRLLGSLFAYQSILKQTNKTAAAELVAKLMDQAVKERDAIRATVTSGK